MPARSLASVSHAASWIVIFSAKLSGKRMPGPAVSANQNERLSRSDSDYWLKEVVKINNPATGWWWWWGNLGTSGFSSPSLLPLFQHQGLFFTERWWNPSTFLTTSQVSAGDRENCVAITTNQSWRRWTFDVAASVWWEGGRRGWSRGGGCE